MTIFEKNVIIRIEYMCMCTGIPAFNLRRIAQW